MPITPTTYHQVTPVIEAVQLTLDNLNDVATWCGGWPVGPDQWREDYQTWEFQTERFAWDHTADAPWPAADEYRLVLEQYLMSPITFPLGYWVYLDAEGKFWCVRPTLFDATYAQGDGTGA